MASASVISPIPVSRFNELSETEAAELVWKWVVADFNHPRSFRDPQLKPTGRYDGYRVLDTVEIRDAEGQVVELYGGRKGPEYPDLKFIRFDYEAVGCPSE